MLTIEWQKTEPRADYSALRGVDAAGNQYTMPANQETCSVRLPDGRRGTDWECAAALREAQAQPVRAEVSDVAP